VDEVRPVRNRSRRAGTRASAAGDWVTNRPEEHAEARVSSSTRFDYDRPNFVHADLDAETFNEMQEQRGETFLGLMLRSIVHEMKRQQEGRGAPDITLFDVCRQ